jgi:hypothetical protein
MALTREEALGLAARYVAKLEAPMELAIDHARTAERAFGWVFVVTTKKHLETERIEDMIPGLGPVAVFHDGRLLQIGTSIPPERAIAELEREWAERQ